MSHSQERVLGVLRGRKMGTFGTGRELFFAFTDKRLMVVDPGLMKFLALNPIIGVPLIAKKTSDFQEKLKTISVQEISQESKDEIFYQDIRSFNVFRKFLTTRFRIKTSDETLEVVLIKPKSLKKATQFFETIPLNITSFEA